MKQLDILLALKPVVNSFEELGIEYYIGGSVASSVYGIARSTQDIDLIAALPLSAVHPLFGSLHQEYYIDENMMRDAIKRESSFNIIHFKTMIKIDVFVLKNTAYDHSAFQRRRLDALDPEEQIKFHIASPEDIIMAKLASYQMGGRVSERQWRDIFGVLKVQANRLDMEYLQRWAKELNLTELLSKAIQETQL